MKTRKKSKLSNKTAFANNTLEQITDQAVNKTAEWSFPLAEGKFSFCSMLTMLSGLGVAIDSLMLRAVWNHLDAAFLILQGIYQLADEREHRRTARKLKGLTNIAAGTQLFTLTIANPLLYAGPAFAAAVGLSFVHSLEDLYRCYKRIEDPAYWYKDTCSELEKLSEEIKRLEAITGNKSSFFGGMTDGRKHKLIEQRDKLQGYIEKYSEDNTKIPPDALKECQKDLNEAWQNTLIWMAAFIAVTMTCFMPMTATPAWACLVAVSAGFMWKNKELVKTFFSKATSVVTSAKSAQEKSKSTESITNELDTGGSRKGLSGHISENNLLDTGKQENEAKNTPKDDQGAPGIPGINTFASITNELDTDGSRNGLSGHTSEKNLLDTGEQANEAENTPKDEQGAPDIPGINTLVKKPENTSKAEQSKSGIDASKKELSLEKQKKLIELGHTLIQSLCAADADDISSEYSEGSNQALPTWLYAHLKSIKNLAEDMNLIPSNVSETDPPTLHEQNRETYLMAILCMMWAVYNKGDDFVSGSYKITGEQKLYTCLRDYVCFAAGTQSPNNVLPAGIPSSYFSKQSSVKSGFAYSRNPKQKLSSHYKKDENQFGIDIRFAACQNGSLLSLLPHEKAHLLFGQVRCGEKETTFLKFEHYGLGRLEDAWNHAINFWKKRNLGAVQGTRREKDVPEELKHFYNIFCKAIKKEFSNKSVSEMFDEMFPRHGNFLGFLDEENEIIVEKIKESFLFSASMLGYDVDLSLRTGNECILNLGQKGDFTRTRPRSTSAPLILMSEGSQPETEAHRPSF